MQRHPTSASVRRLIQSIIKTDSELNALCIDYYAFVYRRFSNGMDRITKENILLERVPLSTIIDDLESHPTLSKYYIQKKGLLKYRAGWKEDFTKRLLRLFKGILHGNSLTPTVASIRNLFDSVVIDDSDMDAFCISYFPGIKKRFSNNMDRTRKANILFEYSKSEQILLAIRDDEALREAFNANEHLLRYHLIDGSNILTLMGTIVVILAIILGLSSWIKHSKLHPSNPLSSHSRHAAIPDSSPTQNRDLGSIAEVINITTPALFPVAPIGSSPKATLCRSVLNQLKKAAIQKDRFMNPYESIEEGNIRGIYRLLLSAMNQNADYEFSVNFFENFGTTLSRFIKFKITSENAQANLNIISQWAEYHLVDQPTKENEQCLQEIFNDVAVKNFSRIFMKSYLILTKFGELEEMRDQDIEHSPEFTICRSSEFIVTERRRWGITVRPYRGNQDDFPDIACLFWLRRYADGSGGALARFGAKIMRRYDPEFWKNHLSEFPTHF